MEFKEKYLKLKKKYDTAFQDGDWNLVEEIEDSYLEAEELFVEAALKNLEGRLSNKYIETLREKWRDPQWTEKVIELLLSEKLWSGT